MTRSWILLSLAILTEVIGSVALEASEGFTEIVPTVVVLIAYSVTFLTLGVAMKVLPLGITYAIWAGAGTALTVLAAMLMFDERPNAVQVAGIVLIIAGVVALNLGTPGATDQPAASSPH